MTERIAWTEWKSFICHNALIRAASPSWKASMPDIARLLNTCGASSCVLAHYFSQLSSYFLFFKPSSFLSYSCLFLSWSACSSLIIISTSPLIVPLVGWYHFLHSAKYMLIFQIHSIILWVRQDGLFYKNIIITEQINVTRFNSFGKYWENSFSCLIFMLLF